MKALFGKIALFGALLLAAAAVSLLPSLAPPNAGATRETTDAGLPYDASYNVLIRGDEVGSPGVYRIPYGCTYGQLFAFASVEPPAGYDLSASVSFADAVLVGGEYYIYFVL